MTRRALLALLVACLLATPLALAGNHENHDPPRGPPDEDEEENGRPGNETGKPDDKGPDSDGAPGQGNPGRGQGKGGPPDDKPGSEKAQEKRAQGLQRANERRAAAEARSVRETVGAFDVDLSANEATGTHVSFEYDRRNITNATYHGLHLFDATADGDVTPSAAGSVDVESRGSQMRLDASFYEARVHDNPSAVFRFDADTVTFSFPNGTVLNGTERRVDIMYDTGETAHLVSGTFAVNGTTATAEGSAVFVLGEKRGAFDKHRDEITNAMAESQVGAEVTVVQDTANGTAAEDTVAFGNVTVQTDAAPGNVTLTVAGEAMDGRVIVANVEPSFFDNASAAELDVLFDGVPAERADSLLHVLSAPEGEDNALYWVVEDTDGYQVIFALPHYSVHTLSILDGLEEVPPSIVAGLVASAVVVGAGGFVLFRRRG